mmetsp:Transcript_40125/g.104001  ORF Transcript_40125/g.104001 Transcript_40125/m.104001 type:complete len:275 (+) Transcript_40125:5651-6475(+)
MLAFFSPCHPGIASCTTRRSTADVPTSREPPSLAHSQQGERREREREREKDRGYLVPPLLANQSSTMFGSMGERFGKEKDVNPSLHRGQEDQEDTRRSHRRSSVGRMSNIHEKMVEKYDEDEKLPDLHTPRAARFIALPSLLAEQDGDGASSTAKKRNDPHFMPTLTMNSRGGGGGQGSRANYTSTGDGPFALNGKSMYTAFLLPPLACTLEAAILAFNLCLLSYRPLLSTFVGCAIYLPFSYFSYSHFLPCSHVCICDQCVVHYAYVSPQLST